MSFELERIPETFLINYLFARNILESSEAVLRALWSAHDSSVFLRGLFG